MIILDLRTQIKLEEKLKKELREKKSLRFLINGINVIIHKKVCDEKNKCNIKKIDSTLAGEIKLAILKEAAKISQSDMEANKEPYNMPAFSRNEKGIDE